MNKPISKLKPMEKLGYLSIGLILVLMLALLFPTTSKDSYASCTDGSSEDCVSTQLSTNVDVTTNTSISLSLASAVKLEVTPISTGALSYSSTKLSVATNSQDGYAIYMQAASDDGALQGVTSNLDGQISNTTKRGVTLAELDNNTYGYALTNTVADETTAYSSIPTTGTIVKSTGTSTPESGDYAYGDTYYLSFGTKIGTSLPAGVYSGSVNVSVVANPVTLRSLYDLTYMQDMTNDICTNTKEHYTKQLIDNRDGKKYWVAKLKDGRCWMTQNLAFDIKLNADGTSNVKAANSDVASDWNRTPSGSGWTKETLSGNGFRPGFSYDIYTKGDEKYYPPVATESTVPEMVSSGMVGYTTYSWNLGDYVVTNPSNTESCGKISDLNACANLTNVEDWTPTFVATTTSAINTGDQSYDAHYLFGNYYQWNTATAGVGETVSYDGGYAGSSICPKGWELPNDPDHTNTGNYRDLLSKYGIALDSSDQNNRVSQSPLYLVHGGQLDYTTWSNGKVLDQVNALGRYWTGYGFGNGYSGAINLEFDSDYIDVTDEDSTSYGMFVRCINKSNI